ncbi:hypothetical protein [Amycolatopsis sp. NPDC051716]|jgi:hypothetical protein|uniref:hypothetical protein n=1 Tax=Amycolatopsis sp. NPDC051716 TaxID=3155804 RepID=UPI00342DEBE5
MEQFPETPAPGDDLIEAGLVIRRLAVEHPALFHIVFQNRADLTSVASPPSTPPP